MQQTQARQFVAVPPVSIYTLRARRVVCGATWPERSSERVRLHFEMRGACDQRGPLGAEERSRVEIDAEAIEPIPILDIGVGL